MTTELNSILKRISYRNNKNGVDFDFKKRDNGESIDSIEIDRLLCDMLSIKQENDDYFSIWFDFLTDVGIKCYNMQEQSINMDKLYKVFDDIDQLVSYSTNPEEFNSKLKSSLLHFLNGEYVFSDLYFH